MSAEVILGLVACGMYAVATVLAIAHAREPGPSRDQDLMIVTTAALACLVAALAVDGLRANRFPAFGAFEAATWYSLSVTAAYLYVALRHEVLRTISAVLLPCLGLVVMLGLLPARGEAAVPMAAPNAVVGIHVTAAFLGYGLFTLEALLAVAYLWQDHNLKHKRFGGLSRMLPSLETLDGAMKELIGPAFVLFTFSIGMGIFLTHVYKWGVHWATDPKVVLTGATWGVYALLFYLRRSADRHGRRLAYVAVLGFILILAAFLGVHLVTHSMHDFGFHMS